MTFDLNLDGDFIERLKKMDDESWGLLFGTYSLPLRKKLYSRLVRVGLPTDDKYLVDEIEQDTWRVAVEKISGFELRGDRSLFYWLSKIQYQHIGNRYRERKREGVRKDMPLEISEESLRPIKGSLRRGPEDRIVSHQSRSEMLSVIDMIMQTVPPLHFKIYIARVQGKTAKQLAVLYGIKPSRIDNIVSRTRKKAKTLCMAAGLSLREIVGSE